MLCWYEAFWEAQVGLQAYFSTTGLGAEAGTANAGRLPWDFEKLPPSRLPITGSLSSYHPERARRGNAQFVPELPLINFLQCMYPF